MTVIVYRDGVMAADRAGHQHDLIVHDITKVVRRESDGALFGACGTSSIAAEARRWFLGQQGIPRPSFGETDECSIEALIVRPDATVERHDRHGWTVVEGPFFAIGLGAEIALGALSMGADAIQAVGVCAYHGIGRRGEHDVVTLRSHDIAKGR